MGMFSKDVLFGGIRLDETIGIGTGPQDSENVLLLDAAVVSKEVPTDLGMASKTLLSVCRLSQDGTTVEGEPVEVGTLASAIAEKVALKAEGDLPAVVCFFKTESKYDSDALVMQFVRRWDGKTPKFTPIAEVIPF